MKAKIFLSVAILAMLVLTACLPGGTLSEEAQQQTQIAEIVQQTRIALAVQQTLAAGSGQADPGDMPPATTGTPSHQGVTVMVSTATYCRSGPGEPFEILGVMQIGETAEVIGRNEWGDTWIIKLPSNPTITCWLWGHYALVTGDTSGLIVYSNPPTPVPPAGFSATYTGMFHCIGFHGFKFQITNTGSVTWESFRMEVNDQTTAVFRSFSDDQFTDVSPTCTPMTHLSDLMPGEVGMAANVGTGSLGYDPTGHTILVYIRLCSQDGLGGFCLEKAINFTP